jgi:adenylosuccinate synthase
MAVDVLLGLQWGDEGKGKIVDYLTRNYNVVCRFQGGPNAGHTLYIDGEKVVLHTIPSGIFYEDVTNVIGNGVVIDPVTLVNEIRKIESMGVNVKKALKISERAHLILPTHRWLDAASEASKGDLKIGSTLRGIGPAYMDNTGRNGLRMGDTLQDGFKEKYEFLSGKHKNLLRIYDVIPEFNLSEESEAWLNAIEELKAYVVDNTIYTVHDALNSGQRVLAEGAQGSMLDVDFGTYPYVTSSNTVTAGVCRGLGVSPKQIGKVIGITKAYCTRVGSGPFPTELFDATGERLMKAGHEFGATTGRPRRCGWLDLVQLKYVCMINGVTELVVTKADVLNGFDTIYAAEHYELNGQLTKRVPLYLEDEHLKPVLKSHEGWPSVNQEDIPFQLTDYINNMTDYLDVPVTHVSIGPERDAILEW